MAPPTVPMMYSSVARTDPPALICVTTMAVRIIQSPFNGMCNAWPTANAARPDAVMRTQKRQRGLEARSKAAMRCAGAALSCVIGSVQVRRSSAAEVIRAYPRVQGKVAVRRVFCFVVWASCHLPACRYWDGDGEEV